MAQGNTQVGYGTTLKWNNIAIAKVTKIGEFGWEVEKASVSTFDATNGSKVVKQGLIDPGDLAVEAVMATDDTTAQGAFMTDAYARTSRAVVVTLPTTLGTTTFTATAFASNVKIGEITPEGIIPLKFTLTFTAAGVYSTAA